MRNWWEIIDEHTVIRETCGYDLISQVDIVDLPEVLHFLKICHNYKKMKNIDKGSFFILNSVGKQPAFIERRHKVVMDYCKKMGWPLDVEKLSIEQILEIRETKKWKDAGKD